MDKEIIKQAAYMYKVLDAKKLNTIEVLDVHELTTLADLFIIVTVDHIRGTKALADELQMKLSERGIEPIQKEGYDSGNWILMDYGQIIVHILVEEDAVFYDLPHLWQDAHIVLF